MSHEISVRRIAIVTPVYNDWDSFAILVEKLSRVAAENHLRIHMIAVDDGSVHGSSPRFDQPAGCARWHGPR